jgi:hypothetical protein
LTDDFLFATTDVAIWSTVEPALGIIACGAICLRPLFKTFYALSTRNKSSAHNLTASHKNSKHSRLRNSHMGPVFRPGGAQELKAMGAKGYRSSSEGDEEIGLRTDIASAGRQAPGKGGATVTSSPFSDENEVARGKGHKTDGSAWEIQVHRTLEITRDELESLGSAGSEPNTPWPARRLDKGTV